jgi:hypothetical protein
VFEEREEEEKSERIANGERGRENEINMMMTLYVLFQYAHMPFTLSILYTPKNADIIMDFSLSPFTLVFDSLTASFCTLQPQNKKTSHERE